MNAPQMNAGQRTTRTQFKKQQGVAIITAVLLTALAITIVGNLFWQQNVQLRMVENQQLKQKTRSIVIGGLDGVRLLLNEDLKNSLGNTDNLTELWATPIAEIRLDTFLERNEDATGVGNASISGQISDASALYNLENLATNRVINKYEVGVLKKLMTHLRLNPSLADTVANAVASSQKLAVVIPNNPNNPPPPGQPQPPGPGQGPGPGQTTLDPNAKPVPATPGKEPAPIASVGDLIALPAFTPEIVNTLKNFVTVLPRQNGVLTTVNINTTSAEVLSARIDTLSLSQAKSIILARGRTPFLDMPRFWSFNNIVAKPEYNLDIKTEFFFAKSHVRIDHADMESIALLYRTTAGTRVLWIREI